VKKLNADAIIALAITAEDMAPAEKAAESAESSESAESADEGAEPARQVG
jgi:hypothetical protein